MDVVGHTADFYRNPAVVPDDPADVCVEPRGDVDADQWPAVFGTEGVMYVHGGEGLRHERISRGQFGMRPPLYATTVVRPFGAEKWEIGLRVPGLPPWASVGSHLRCCECGCPNRVLDDSSATVQPRTGNSTLAKGGSPGKSVPISYIRAPKGRKKTPSIH